MKPETAAIHLSNQVNDLYQPVIQPITLSTTYLHGESSLVYGRFANPNRASLERVMAALELGREAAAFSSGNTAGMAVFQCLEQGSHVVAPLDMYHGLKKQLLEVFRDTLAVTFVDMTQPEQVRSAIKPETSLIWVESPSNPLIQITNIPLIAQIAKEAKVRMICDNTFATPILQNPLTLGADMVMHSATKYIGGHSDVLAGILVTKEADEFWQSIKTVQAIGGAVPSPFDCYLLCRSIKTLAYRMKGHCANAQAVAEYLHQHPLVEKVIYPGLPSDPGYTLAGELMRGFGGMVTFLVKGGAKESDRFVQSLRYFSNATSLGGVESLIERRAHVEGPDSKSPENLIRMSVGLENIADLTEDLASGLKTLGK
ncbi:MAG: aminotransferase class I/II-fold pyridoxal phosphate-dependent enzyme [Lunatimonas sp.]|uniref:trans-sulfuration enzyme family protein n=1 Tax=Lunatimonas sp. TaxID=2060141 RepID=UPI00263A9ECC|nr:aminotransferase class I/II-fold pyridoxal phosphate-dependent enzyme [Lunatimonas sp.]MCC5939694.1 aminotransferase class I/II-fold pyridoxal phosphate-dependent enzyme [Lunatimonas sp.]